MKKILVPGVFDVFHIGHLNYLKRAATFGDHLTVAIQEDRAVELAKGTALVTPLPERIALIEELRFVDDVVSYIDVFQGPLLQKLNINTFACGEEYGLDKNFPDQVKTLEFCKDNNINIARIPRTNHVSSTKIRSQLKAFWSSRAAKKEDLPAGVTVLGSFGGDQEKIMLETQKEIELILKSSGDYKNKSLLDLACGDGRLLAELSNNFKESTGVDFSKELLNIAEERLNKQSKLVECEVSEFFENKQYDILLLSGILPCLDDLQQYQLLKNIRQMSNENSKCLVRTSIALSKRINIVNQFSKELGTTYTAYYKTVSEIEKQFLDHGWKCGEKFQLYQHREDTAVWWFEFTR